LKVYHGTSYENYLNIMEEGFNPTHKNWLCSSKEHMYFFNPNYVKDYDDINSIEIATKRSIEKAFNNARYTAAYNKSISDKVIVLELEVSEDYILRDSSEGSIITACQIRLCHFDLTNITKIYKSDYSPFISLFYLRNMNRNMFCHLKLNRYELKLLETVNHFDNIHELYETDNYEEIS
jgi:hypothetical protein